MGFGCDAINPHDSSPELGRIYINQWSSRGYVYSNVSPTVEENSRTKAVWYSFRSSALIQGLRRVVLSRCCACRDQMSTAPITSAADCLLPRTSDRRERMGLSASMLLHHRLQTSPLMDSRKGPGRARGGAETDRAEREEKQQGLHN